MCKNLNLLKYIGISIFKYKMIDVMFASLPVIASIGTMVAIGLNYVSCLPTFSPEVVLVRCPYGFPRTTIDAYKHEYQTENGVQQYPVHHIQYPIRD